MKTNREHLIEMLFQHCPGNVTKQVVEECFKIINKYDWAVFCSQMGDYDHPGERIHAKEVMEKELEEFKHPFGTVCYTNIEVAEHVIRNLTMDIYPAHNFYHQHFHNLEKEFVGF